MSHQFRDRNPLKLLYWTPRFWPDVGGIEVLSKSALPALNQRGYEILVLTSHSTLKDHECTEFEGITVHRFPFWSALKENNILKIVSIKKQILHIIAEFDPDLIHFDVSGYNAFFLNTFLKDYPKPFIVSLHGILQPSALGPDTTLSQLFRKAAWVTTISDSVLNYVRTSLPEITDRTSTIYGFADFPDSSPDPLPIDKPVILAIGRLETEKGFDILIEAFNILSDEFPDLSINIVGNGSQREKLQKLAADFGLSNRVKLTGMVTNTQLPDWINQAYLIAVPSRNHEGFGVVAVEAGLLGRPVVASDLDGLRETVIHGETGILVPLEDSKSLADAIRELLKNPEVARRMGHRARTRALEKFSLEKYVDQYDKLYRQLVDQIKG